MISKLLRDGENDGVLGKLWLRKRHCAARKEELAGRTPGKHSEEGSDAHEVKRRHKGSKRGSGAASCKRAAQECMRDRAPSECVGKNLLSSSLSSSVSACPSAANQLSDAV